MDFWKRKLLAFLHDPPDKCFDLGAHEDIAASHLKAAALDYNNMPPKEQAEFQQIKRLTDHFAAAADRFIFPRGKCATTFTGQTGETFKHPFSAGEFILPKNFLEHRPALSAALQTALGAITSDDPRRQFFLHWRRWLDNACLDAGSSNTPYLAFLPADTRIPDHTIWNHNTAASAAAGCYENGDLHPSLLLFQFGPVQDFIAQARSTRDLWSGSYLLSWLIAHAIKAITQKIGPDAIIFPNLRGNGIFDALHKDEIYNCTFKNHLGEQETLWTRLKKDKDELQFYSAAKWVLSPTLPNRFLALVPESQAETLAQAAEEALQTELDHIGSAVWQWLEKEAGAETAAPWRVRYDQQIKDFPQITWAIQPWLERKQCLAEFAKLPVCQSPTQAADGLNPLQRLQTFIELAEKDLQPEFTTADAKRYFLNAELKNSGILWSAHYALLEAKLAARRNTRDFAAWAESTPSSDRQGTPKDSLSGKEEIIGNEDFWEKLQNKPGKLFSGSHHYGALNLIKRIWCRTDETSYLSDKLGLSGREIREVLHFDSLASVACENQAKSRNSASKDGEKEPNNPYLAILAMDGDNMGKWLSGEMIPEFLPQLSSPAKKVLRPFLERRKSTSLQRLLTPSYHLQFSEALANFATWLAGPIVEHFHGQLIYAGGDDILAILPADYAIACAQALRNTFQGKPSTNQNELPLAIPQPGFVNIGIGHPLLLPGSRADVSAGLAFGHCQTPLQKLIQEARKAEHEAKHTYQKGAIAFTLYKRSGEIIKWGCKWDTDAAEGPQSKNSCQALALLKYYAELCNRPQQERLSQRFPYALSTLLQPYQEKPFPGWQDIYLQEFNHVLQQQGHRLPEKERQKFRTLAKSWLQQTCATPDAFSKLFLTQAFIGRERGED